MKCSRADGDVDVCLDPVNRIAPACCISTWTCRLHQPSSCQPSPCLLGAGCISRVRMHQGQRSSAHREPRKPIFYGIGAYKPRTASRGIGRTSPSYIGAGAVTRFCVVDCNGFDCDRCGAAPLAGRGLLAPPLRAACSVSSFHCDTDHASNP